MQACHPSLTIGDRAGRKTQKTEVAKSRGARSFNGKLAVLIDSKTASAAEILARVVQLEKRGTVLGDRSAGAVMEAREFVHAVRLDVANVTQYGAFITVADLKMPDGKSLEGTGVTPDERILPTAADLAQGRDPVLARAAEIAGIAMTPDEAGRILPFVWPQAQMPEIGLCGHPSPAYRTRPAMAAVEIVNSVSGQCEELDKKKELK